MKKIIIQTIDAIHHSVILSELNNAEIPYQERVLQNPSFTSLGTAGNYGEIIISTDYGAQVEEIMDRLDSVDHLELIDEEMDKYPPKSDKKINYAQIGLIFYAITITILFFKHWHINYRNSSDKNFNYSWNTQNTVLSCRDKINNKLFSRSIDANYDYNFEKIEFFINGKGPVSISYDRDEDGFAEQLFYYSTDKDRKYAGKYLDEDHNQIYEYSEIVLENGDTLKFTDEDHDGLVKLITK